MAELEREHLIGQLELLGSEDDAAVLAAARAVHRSVAEAGVTWNELLRPQSTDTDEEPEATVAAPVAVDHAEDARVIDALLAKKSLSGELREELTGLRQDLEEGEFTAMDANYVRALATRLDA